MAKIHISKAGKPVNCPAKISCRLAPEIGHFDKVEQAEAFADELNELRAENRTHLGYNSKDVKSMTNAELVYISNKIKDEAKENENYKDYKGSVKWQKEVRSQASRDMQELLNQNNIMINQIGEQVDRVNSLTKSWKNEKDLGQKRAFYNALKIERDSLNTLRDTYGPKINENMSKFQELQNKKETAEEKILNGMRKQALHSETKAILADVESEINDRGIAKTENLNKSAFSIKSSEILNSSKIVYPELGDVTSEDEVRQLEEIYDQKINNIEQEIAKNDSDIERLKKEAYDYRVEMEKKIDSVTLSDDELNETKERHNFSDSEYEKYLSEKNKTFNPTEGINNPKLENIIKNHALKEKFGPNKGKEKNRPLREADINWINEYKNNPELMKNHLNIINSNRKKDSGSLQIRSKYLKYEFEIRNKEAEYRTALSAERSNVELGLQQEISHKIRENNNLSFQKEGLIRAKKMTPHKLTEYSNLTKANNGNAVKIASKTVLSSNSSKVSLDRDSISTNSNGNINNVFVRYDSSLLNNSNQIHKVARIEGNSLIMENGEKLNPEKTLYRPSRGRLDYRYNNIEVIYGEKSGSDYTGQTEINYHEFDSTD